MELTLKSYPSIGTKIPTNIKFHIFNKLDGSNIRAEWCRKKGFYRFGSRTKLININTPILGESINLFLEKYNESLSKIFFDKKYEKVVCFSEFFGKNSFAGSHIEEDKKDIVLFDINPYKKGFLSPQDFLSLTENIDTSKLLTIDFLSEELIYSIKKSELKNMTLEGIVAKAVSKNKIFMTKVKTEKWLNLLKIYCNNDLKKFHQLK